MYYFGPAVEDPGNCLSSCVFHLIYALSISTTLLQLILFIYSFYYLCSEGKTLHLLKSITVFFWLHFQGHLSHTFWRHSKPQSFSIFGVCVAHTVTFLWAHFWDLCWIPRETFPKKHIRFDSCYYFTSETTPQVCSYYTGFEPASRRYKGTHFPISTQSLHLLYFKLFFLFISSLSITHLSFCLSIIRFINLPISIYICQSIIFHRRPMGRYWITLLNY